jgi:YesN/AraC family two-component response regulator
MAMVAETGTGREAIQQFRANRPDVTLMDVRMPEMNGLDALIEAGVEEALTPTEVVVLPTCRG